MRHTTAFLVALSMSVSANVAFACADRDAAVETVEAVSAGADLNDAIQVYDRIDVDPACDDRLRDWLSDFIGAEATRRAADPGLAPEVRVALLSEAARYSQTWEAHAALGEAAFEARDFSRAAVAYQVALDRVNAAPDDAPITRDDVDGLREMATYSIALSDEPVLQAVSRSGAPSGVFAPQVRGFEYAEVESFVTFEFDSVEFDDNGEINAVQVLNFLRSQPSSRVTLIGHTDPVGTEDYNMQLSIERADALRAYLLANGVSVEIRTEGRGESEPRNIPASVVTTLSEEEIHELNRRVQMVLG